MLHITNEIEKDLVWSETEHDYDFIGIVKNDSDTTKIISFKNSDGTDLPNLVVPSKDWVGILADDEGRLMMQALKDEAFEVLGPKKYPEGFEFACVEHGSDEAGMILNDTSDKTFIVRFTGLDEELTVEPNGYTPIYDDDEGLYQLQCLKNGEVTILEGRA